MHRGGREGTLGGVPRPSLLLALLCLGALASAPPRARAQDRFAVALFHFNIQYAAGGLTAFPLATPPEPDGAAVEDAIVVQSFAPILDLYHRHPTWGVDLELQGYFLDVLAARHPAVLDLLREMAASGQIDVVSFHYSDQLFLAYPQIDWERSNDLTRDAFERHGVRLSQTVFCQEGQSGMAMARRMAERGYSVMVWPKNLWREQHGEWDAAPLYRFGDITLVVGAKPVTAVDRDGTELRLSWTFLDDGELAATGGQNPYFTELFVERPEEVAAYERRLTELEADGYRIATVGQYVEAVRDRVPLAELPPLLDGTWQPGSTRAVLKWMGGRSIWSLDRPDDRDNHVRTLGYQAHRELVAAETAATATRLSARDRLDAAWRLLSLGQVTDATGINPYRGEVEYGVAHLAESLRLARSVIDDARAALGGAPLVVDVRAGTATPGELPAAQGAPAAPLLEVVAEATDETRAPTVRWERVSEWDHRVVVHFGPAASGRRNEVQVTFRGEPTDELVTTLALDDGARPTTFRRSDFSFDLGGGDEDFYLALPLGLVSLGPRRFLVKDTGHVHLAARVFRNSGDVVFRDETLWAEESATWVFHVFDGSAEEAAAFARRLNSEPRLSR